MTAMSRKAFLTLAVAGVMTSGTPTCAAAATVPAEVGAGDGCNGADAKLLDKQDGDGQRSTPASVLPMMGVTIGRPCVAGSSPVGGYTRLSVEFEPVADGGDSAGRLYDRERRDGLKRFFMGKSTSRILTIKSTLARPKVALTTTVAQIDHTSNRKVGESWTSSFNSQRVLTPFFRIDPDSAINLEMTLTVTSTYDTSVTSNVLDIVKRATLLVAPSAALVTSLNQDRFGQASQFVDQSIANLLKESIVERASNDFPVKNWSNATLATVDVMLPLGNEITPDGRKADQNGRPIGRWIIKSAPPILSIFSDAELIDAVAPAGRRAAPKAKAAAGQAAPAGRCAVANNDADLERACRAFRNLDPQTVMNFEVDDGVTLAQTLAGETGIGAARDTLIKATQKMPMQDAVRSLCGLVADKAQSLGFNRFDIAAILWAYSRQGFVTEATALAMQNPDSCAPLGTAYLIGLPKESF